MKNSCVLFIAIFPPYGMYTLSYVQVVGVYIWNNWLIFPGVLNVVLGKVDCYLLLG